MKGEAKGKNHGKVERHRGTGKGGLRVALRGEGGGEPVECAGRAGGGDGGPLPAGAVG